MGSKLELTSRDWKVLSGLEKWGVLGLGQLFGIAAETEAGEERRVARFFNETYRRDYSLWFSQRLTALVKHGYIKDNFYLNHSKAFTLAERGHKALQAQGLAVLKGFRWGISAELLSHELNVAAVGLVLSDIHGLKVRAERERYIWSSNGGRTPAPTRALSDLWIVDPQPKAIEVEISQKSEHRYKEIWDAYRLRLPHNSPVLYLTGWPDGVRCILYHARQFRAPFVHACALDAFRASCGRAAFKGILEGQPFLLAQSGSGPAAPSLQVSGAGLLSLTRSAKVPMVPGGQI